MLLSVNAVSKAHGARVLFKDVSVRIDAGMRLALVGANGAGKTTLLDIMAGDQPADSGEVTRRKDAIVGMLKQEVERGTHATVVAHVVAAAGEASTLEARLRAIEAAVSETEAGPEQDTLLLEYGHLQERYEHLGGYELEAEARRLLAGLGFAEHEMERDPSELSGGWLMRVSLAGLLLANPDVLLLDEPTNHLDLASVTWLQGFLKEYAGAMVLVSHDRDFINAICNRVVEIAFGAAKEYVGDYASFVEQRALAEEMQIAAMKNQQRKLAETERFIERFRYKASKAKQVQSRVKQLGKIERIDAPRASAKRA